MSIKSIESAETTQYQYKGVTFFANPKINVRITSDGKVFNFDNKKYMNAGQAGTYSVKINGEYNQVSFQSLLSRFFGIKKTVSQLIVPNDNNLGYVPGNLKIVENPNKPGRKKGSAAKKIIASNKKFDFGVKEIAPNIYEKTAEIELHGFRIVPLQVDHKFICGDGYSFDNKDDAKKHQANVDFAKQCARLVVERKAGYVLAQDIFLMHVHYTNENRPYKDFKEMLWNDSDIIEEGEVAQYRFVPQEGLGEFKDILLSEDSTFTFEQAATMTQKLSEMNSNFNDILSIVTKS